jgi:hypothetical protein
MRFAIVAPDAEEALPVWDDDAALPDLDALIDRADDAAHEVWLRDADLLDQSPWFRGARTRTRDRLLELQALALASAWTPDPGNAIPWRVSSEQEARRALAIARSPLLVLVEDDLRDGALVETAVRLLLGTETLKRLWLLSPPSPPVVDFRHAGGVGGVPARIAAEARRARDTGLPLRVIAVVDSDRSGPGLPPSDNAQRVKVAAKHHGAHAFILTKRTGESYLPDFHWEGEKQRDPNNPRWAGDLDRMVRLPCDDRDYCDMNDWKHVPGGYDSGRPYHLEVLVQCAREAEGDAAALARMAADLRARDHTGDLTAILELIERER